MPMTVARRPSGTPAAPALPFPNILGFMQDVVPHLRFFLQQQARAIFVIPSLSRNLGHLPIARTDAEAEMFRFPLRLRST
jgi:hypothetical protein